MGSLVNLVPLKVSFSCHLAPVTVYLLGIQKYAYIFINLYPDLLMLMQNVYSYVKLVNGSSPLNKTASKIELN